MFGFSLGKLIVLVAIVVAVWYGFRFLGRLERQRKRRLRRQARAERERGGIGRMVRCPVCGAYVAADISGSCGKVDCPY